MSPGCHGDGGEVSDCGQFSGHRLDGVQVYPSWLLRNESPARGSLLLEGKSRLSFVLPESQGHFMIEGAGVAIQLHRASGDLLVSDHVVGSGFPPARE